MFQTLCIAEQAAGEVETQDWDSQHCKRLQADLLSLCPAPQERKSKSVASASTAITTVLNFVTAPPATIEATLGRDPSYSRPSGTHRLLGINEDAAFSPKHRNQPVHRPAMAFDTPGKDPDLTQRSSMSLTQENSYSAYELLNVQTTLPLQNPLNVSNADGHADGPKDYERTSSEEIVARESVHGDEQPSTRTDMTPHTYTENDTGHITLGYNPEQDGISIEQAESQDASYAVARIAPSSQPPLYEPQTPAPPINPFKHRGSVLREFEMFGATQPSSIGRHVASPTSSRPSPDVYNDFTSPPRRLASSPLQRRNDEDEKIPVPSSLRNILGQSVSDVSPHTTTPRASDIQLFDAERLLPRTNQLPEPRRYNPMKESQERRKALESTPPESEFDESDSDIDSEPRKRHQRKQRERDIQRQLSTIELHQPKPLTQPGSSNSALVEVPSTSIHRRSSQGDYLGRYEIVDARDAQQDDFIADSQGRPPYCEDAGAFSPSGLRSSNHTAAAQTRNHDNDSEMQPHASRQSTPRSSLSHSLGPEVSRISGEDATQSPSPQAEQRPESHLEANLPLQNISPSCNGLKTPLAVKSLAFSDPCVATVPETSSPPDQLRPMGDIGLSFGPDEDEESLHPPGFTQDEEFFDILNRQVSPEAPRRIRNLKRKPLDIITSPAREKADSNLKTSPPTQFLLPQSGPSRILTTEPDFSIAASGPRPTTSKNEDVTDRSRGNRSFPSSPVYSRMGLRSKGELKGPSRDLRRSSETPAMLDIPIIYTSESVKPSSDADTTISSSSELSPAPSTMHETTLQINKTSAPLKTATRRSQHPTASKQPAPKDQTNFRGPLKRSTKRKSAPAPADETRAEIPPRASKRQAIGSRVKEDSVDPLSLPTSSVANNPKLKEAASKIFNGMAFAVSYVKQEQEKDTVIMNIAEYGGTILEDGFDNLFETGAKPIDLTDSDKQGLIVCSAAMSIGFVALIADEHSRKSKYMQALALGLPCISGRWIVNCIAKGAVLNWTSYLLCAGQSSFLGNTFLSRTLAPYSAAEATFPTTVAARNRILQRKSVLLIMSKNKTAYKRKMFMFLTRALGPSRLGQVADHAEARRRLLEAESCGRSWDLLYVGANATAAESAIFSPAPISTGGSGKRKRVPTGVSGSTIPIPAKIRILTDEDIIQSLILGQLVEE